MHTHGFQDDFQWVRDELWTDTDGDAGASVADNADAPGGTVVLTTGATDNNEAYRESPERFLIAENKPLVVTALMQYAEANTDDANVIFGLGSAPGADALIDDGGGVYAGTSVICIYKIDGETRWRVRTDDNAVVTDRETDVTAGGAGNHTLRIEINPVSATEAEVIFYIDDAGGSNLEQCREQGSSVRAPLIKETINYSATTEMALFFGIKAGGANSEVLTADLVDAWQER